MQIDGGQRLYSATDLVGFLECEQLTALDLRALDDPNLLAQRSQGDESAQLIARKGTEHERNYLEALRARGRRVVDIADGPRDNGSRVERTLAAMRDGAEVIYQATLRSGPWVGHADFLVRVDGAAPALGAPWHYEVADTKLARSPKAKFLVQLAFYSDLLSGAQGVAPGQMHVVLGDGTQRAYRCADYMHYFGALRERFVGAVTRFDEGTAQLPYPLPCDHCSLCHWSAWCEDWRLGDDHLSQVAGITQAQIAKLEQAGVRTMEALATLPADGPSPRIHTDTLDRLRHQAVLQHAQKCTGRRHQEALPLEPEGRRGFYRMPAPDEGDLFFDMEGDPLEPGGLEYLFGVWFRGADGWEFKAFWAHDRTQERAAFEHFVDFVVERRERFPGAHVYHYASYELTALRRLACVHATRESQVDDFQRQGALVDLYKVVREALRLSEPSYSIKYVERFYRPARAGDVQNAGASIVCYERWRETGQRQLLADIEAYNRDDVESTQQLRDWLLAGRPADLPWWSPAQPSDKTEDLGASAKIREIEDRLAVYRARLVDSLPADRLRWTAAERAAELSYQLLDFHRRAAKPAWWALFARMDLAEEDLLEDPDCLAGMTIDPANPPVQVRKSTRYTYLAPEQDTKLCTGDSVTRCDTAETLGDFVYDETTRRVQVKVGPSKQPLPDRLSIGAGGPIDARRITAALFRFADSLLVHDERYSALEQLLRREPPRLHDRAPGQPIVEPAPDLVPGCIAAARALDRSYLYVQGPPGSGKTYTGSRVIAALLADGHRVGIMSNSHKAINHLMNGAMQQAMRQGIAFRAIKKATKGKPETEIDDPCCSELNCYDNGAVWESQANLVGGTAWLFCDPEGDQALDYLFVDEAGQVALANLVAAGMSARNIVLLGDQMQLSQPVQGVHPGRSGDSALDYLLDGAATIAPDRGIFLATTWRMHPQVCRFISEAVYDGRLEPEPGNARQSLVLGAGAHPLLKYAGIVHAAITHEGCSQRSEPEAGLVADVYASALAQRYTDRQGVEHEMTPDNILVVAPYNVQVNLLKQRLPAGARVGTVDKFQGQEAEVVIVSMTTSSEADLPRYIEFLYSRNRLNVAVSRARCLSIVVANPALMAIKCRTPEQMALVNGLCWVAEVGRHEVPSAVGHDKLQS